MILRASAKTLICRLIIISVLLSIAILPAFTVKAADPIPKFTNADREIPGLGLEIDKSFDAPYKTDEVTGFHARYSKVVDDRNSFRFDLRIMHFLDVTYANSFYNFLVNDLELNDGMVQYYQNQSSTDLIEVRVEPNYRSILWGPKNYPVGKELPYYTANRMIRLDDHYYIAIEGLGNGFVNREEVKRITDILEQHARNVVNSKKSGTSVIKNLPAPEPWQKQVAMIIWHSGTTEISRSTPDQWFPLKDGMLIYSGDHLHSLQDSKFKIEYRGFSTSKGIVSVVVSPESRLDIPSKDKPLEGVTDYIEFIKGRFWMIIEGLQNERFAVETSNAIAGVKGTELEIIVQNDVTTINVLDGTVEMSDLALSKTVSINADQTSTVFAEGLPSDPKSFNPNQLDRWWERTPESSFKIMFIIIPAAVITLGVIAFLLFRKWRKSAPQHGIK